VAVSTSACTDSRDETSTLARAHVEAGVSHHLGRGVGVLAAQVGQHDLLPGANTSRDRLTNRSCSDNDNDFAHATSYRVGINGGASYRSIIRWLPSE
jgi:hypothetical protein